MTADRVAVLWSPYVTMTEGLKLTSQSSTNGPLHALLRRRSTPASQFPARRVRDADVRMATPRMKKR